MRKRYSWLLLVVIFALVAASCSSSSDDTTTTAGSATEDTTPSTETTAAPAATTTSAADTGGEILTDVGVDLEAGIITLGMLSDLSGPFAGLVGAINGGHEAYWAFVNANGGIDGLQVELEVVDTGYAVPEHVTLYEQLKDQVVAFGSSVGSPHKIGRAPCRERV